jgi:hypothetical protein
VVQSTATGTASAAAGSRVGLLGLQVAEGRYPVRRYRNCYYTSICKNYGAGKAKDRLIGSCIKTCWASYSKLRGWWKGI